MKKKDQVDAEVSQSIQVNEGNTGFLTVKLLSEILVELRKLSNKK